MTHHLRKAHLEATLRRPRDLNAFAPTSPTARKQIDGLINRGAELVQVRPSLVVLRRAGHTVRIDAAGRVDWAS